MYGPRLPNGRYYGRHRNKPIKSRTTRKATTVPTVIDTEKIAQRVVKSAMSKRTETKHRDGALTANPDWVGEVFNMIADPSGGTVITQGVGVGQYVGEQIRVSSIRLRYAITYADSTNMFRVIVFQSRGTFAPVTMADVLQSVTNYRAPLSGLDLDYDQRFALLYDSGVIVVSSVDKPQLARDVYISGKYIRATQFTDAAGSPEDGGIFIGIISDSGVSAHPAFNGYWRINYKDN